MDTVLYTGGYFKNYLWLFKLETYEKTLNFCHKLVYIHNASLLLIYELNFLLNLKLAFDYANKSRLRRRSLEAIIPFSVNK